jgi:uncharacterized membrane protein required for colicin V production
MMHVAVAVLPPAVAGGKFNYFDFLAIVWLIIGLFRGRKRGMSQELLPLLQWTGIVVAAGLLYWPFSSLIRQYTQFDVLWSVVVAYLLIALGVHLLYLWLKQIFAAKLVEKDWFGRSEFYLGMMAGMVRFACMLLVVLALTHSHVATAIELAKTEKFQRDNFSDIRFPTYGQIQHDVFFSSFSGYWVDTHLQPVLIASINTPEKQKSETMAQKSNRMIDEIIAKPGK